jgi:kynurenine formamidase
MEIYGAAANQVNLESDESATDLLTEPVQQPRRGFAVDTVLVATHGTTTHLDALCHVWEDGTLYNGFPAADIRHDGALTLGIENLDGLVTRGVLLDVARLRGVATLAPTDLITDDDVRLCEAQGGFQIESGDAVLIHTGWPATYTTDKRAYARSQPGVGASAGLYLADRDISLLGADNSAVQPYYGRNPADDVRAAISDLHLPYLRNLGIYLLEMLDLSTLARDRVDQFLFCLAPLKVTGGTGSPVNPIAVG